jgi:hypothetical protein
MVQFFRVAKLRALDGSFDRAGHHDGNAIA